MGLASWIVAGLVALALARFIPSGRSRTWLIEILVAVLGAMVLGGVAAALDFGGWRELEWPAALFSFAGTAAALGLLRLAKIMLRAES